ncbi:MAG: bifunctional riboflavin kinase/FAD synthetase [Actinomycetia bacterium]|nr:bifunctional riboflavin kinase/FAD synthetase [Actinomycetes bacterium]
MTEIIELQKLGADYLAGKKIVVVIGFFDGLHQGHQKIIGKCIQRAEKINGSSLVFTFDKPPLNVIKGSTHKKLITSFEEKLELIGRMGVDYIVTESFSRQFSMISPRQFCQKILLEKFHLKEIFVGSGFRFGYKGQGDEQYLKQFFLKHGVKVNIIPLYRIGDITVSSTNIRKFYGEGDIDKVKLLLGRKPCLWGMVEEGAKRGRGLGFPTANIGVGKKFVFPGDGVYLGEAELDKPGVLPCLVNIGNNPTFGNSDTQLEVFILDFNKSIYGAKIRVCFLKKLRREIKFSSPDQLKLQIEKDVRAAKNYFNIS